MLRFAALTLLLLSLGGCSTLCKHDVIAIPFFYGCMMDTVIEHGVP